VGEVGNLEFNLADRHEGCLACIAAKEAMKKKELVAKK
jgi:hypothetical protein